MGQKTSTGGLKWSDRAFLQSLVAKEVNGRLGGTSALACSSLARTQHFPSTSPLPGLLVCFKSFSSRFRAGNSSWEEAADTAHCELLAWLGAVLLVVEAGRGLGVGGMR